MMYYDEDRDIWVVKSPFKNEIDLMRKNGWTPDTSGRETGSPGAFYTDRLFRAIACQRLAPTKLREKLRKLADDRTEAIIRSHSKSSDIAIPMPPLVELKPFQKAGIEQLDKRLNKYPGVLLADQMGLGKTIQAIGLANLRQCENILVICPATLKHNWADEIEKFAMLKIRQIMGPKSDYTKLPKTGWSIINYDILARRSKFNPYKPGPPELWVKCMTWDLIIIDEAHALKSPTTKRSIAILGTNGVPAVKAKSTIFLTGTPWPNWPIEAQPIVGFAAPEEFGNYWRFAMRYAGATRTQFGWDVRGASNMDELNRRLRETIMIRRDKRDVLPELPKKLRQIIHLEAEGRMAKLIEKERTALISHQEAIRALKTRKDKAEPGSTEWAEASMLLKDEVQVAFQEMARLRADTAWAKTPQVIQYLKTLIEGGEKVVFMAYHRRVVEAVHTAFGGKAVKLYGGMTPEQKNYACKAFQEDANIRVFSGSMIAAGVGLTLTAASTIVFGELDWVPATISQAEDRIHRIGQEEPCLAVHLVVDGSLDAKIAQRITTKQEIFDKGVESQISFNEEDLLAL